MLTRSDWSPYTVEEQGEGEGRVQAEVGELVQAKEYQGSPETTSSRQRAWRRSTLAASEGASPADTLI